MREGRTQLPHGFRLTGNISGMKSRYSATVRRRSERQNMQPAARDVITCDADGGNFGRLLEWEDTWGECRRWAMPMEMLSGSGEELRRVIAG